MMSPADYESWYHTPRGRWIGDREFALLMQLLRPDAGGTLLDVGCGTGHFSRRFYQAGLKVTALDPDATTLAYARRQSDGIAYIDAAAERLPFADGHFDYCSAITSLCFVADPLIALQELWRVSKRGIVLGLLNRQSLLYRNKAGQGAYAGARWDTCTDVRQWACALQPAPVTRVCRSAVFLPGAGAMARLMETVLPTRLLWGGFLAVCLKK